MLLAISEANSTAGLIINSRAALTPNLAEAQL